ncbi:hypothetical protein NPIL_431301, partial [Nephila pilipes]
RNILGEVKFDTERSATKSASYASTALCKCVLKPYLESPEKSVSMAEKYRKRFSFLKKTEAG